MLESQLVEFFDWCDWKVTFVFWIEISMALKWVVFVDINEVLLFFGRRK
jgi:hypothetical protein